MQEMSFWDHLEELRGVLFKMAVVIGVLFIGFFIAMPYIFDEVILAPCRSDFILYQSICDLSQWIAIQTNWVVMPEFCAQDFHVKVININLTTQFFTHFSTAFWLSVVVSFPILLYFLWSFVKPALYNNEIAQIRGVFSLGSILFLMGIAVGYILVFPLTLRFLASYELSTLIENNLSLNSYMENFILLIFSMGIVFELPMLALFLSKIGILHKSFFKQYRRYAVVAALILASIITPSGDPFSMMSVFLPIYLLYEFSSLLVKE